MLGRKEYTYAELEHARSEVVGQLAAYEVLAGTLEDPAGLAALEVFSPGFFTTMLLALDRPFVHRLHLVTGTDGNGHSNCTNATCDCRTRTVPLGLQTGRTYEIAVFGADHAMQMNPHDHAQGQSSDQAQRQSAQQNAMQLPEELTGPSDGCQSRSRVEMP